MSADDAEDRRRCRYCQRVARRRSNDGICVDREDCAEEIEANDNLRRMLQAFVQACGGIESSAQMPRSEARAKGERKAAA